MNRKFHGPASLGTFNKWHPLLYKDTDSGSGKAVLRNIYIYMYMITWLTYSMPVHYEYVWILWAKSFRICSTSLHLPAQNRLQETSQYHLTYPRPSTKVLTKSTTHYIKQHLNTSCMAQPTPFLQKTSENTSTGEKRMRPNHPIFTFAPPPKKKTKAPCVHKQSFKQKKGAPWGT